MQIEDGRGSGRKAEVDPENRLITRAITEPLLEVINEDFGRLWSVPFEGLAPSGATWFFLLQNNGQQTIAVCSIVMAASVAGVFRVSKVTGTPAGGSAIIAANMNLNRTTLPDTVLVQGAASITGLTEAYLIYPIYLPANSPFVYDSVSRIYMPPGTGVAIKAPAAAVVNGFIQFYEEPSE